jgi:alkylhydroperoxidase/carboxymuconolactone decarboxylase family protein YurZ
VGISDLHRGELSAILTERDLEQLRAGYDGHALIELKVAATSAPHSALAPWVSAIGSTFFGDTALAARDRELCLITLLSFRAPGISVCTHVYAGLMEGLSVQEICQAVGLAGCYGGLPAYTESIGAVRKTLSILKRCVERSTCDTRSVLDATIDGLS